MKRVYLKIYGKVQGVFFRLEAKKQAEFLGLAGWVRNTSDGAVELLLEGSEEVLKKMIKWCKLGSRLAKVERVEEKWSDINKISERGFKIRY